MGVDSLDEVGKWQNFLKNRGKKVFSRREISLELVVLGQARQVQTGLITLPPEKGDNCGLLDNSNALHTESFFSNLCPDTHQCCRYNAGFLFLFCFVCPFFWLISVCSFFFFLFFSR